MLDYVKDAGLVFTGKRTKRTQTDGIVIHHRAGYGTVKSCHDQNISGNGWIGIGYNFYVRLDGSVWYGRGLEYVGAHAGRKKGCAGYEDGAYNNSRTIGIGCEGLYHPESYAEPTLEMPEAQFNAVVKLIRDLQEIYPSIKWIKGHKEMPGTATACPGKYFPLDKIKAAVASDEVKAEAEPAPVAKPVVKPVVKPAKTIPVVDMQKAMRKDGYYIGKTGADGTWGPNTNAAAKACLVRYKKPYTNTHTTKVIQKYLGVAVDGKCGPKTQAAIVAFQKQYGLDPDGIAGVLTKQKMCGVKYP